MNDPYIIEARPTSAVERMRRWLRGRRIMLAGLLALAEVVGFIIWRPSALLLATLAVVLLVLCVMGASRVGPGIVRDLLLIVAIAQGIVVVVPLVVGASVVLGVIVAIFLIIGLVAIAARWRV